MARHNREHPELLEIVDNQGNVRGLATREELHTDPALLHRVVHVLVFNSRGELLLQKRSLNKDVAPGLWDTSVGGHVEPGEEVLLAAKREMFEELGIASETPLVFLHSYRFTNRRESELVHTFRCGHEGPFDFNQDEIQEVRFWTVGDISRRLGEKIFSGHFAAEFRRYLDQMPDQTPRSPGP